MIKVENIDFWGFEHAVRGMRNPMNSWDRSDSFEFPPDEDGSPWLGNNDLDLMKRLYSAGTEHRKYLRQIFVSMDITAPLYWWKEFDTYKVGTVSNSCSTMHKIAEKEFTLEDFSHEHLIGTSEQQVPYSSNVPYIIDFRIQLEQVITSLNNARELYIETKDKKYWWQMIQLLPSSYNQKRTVTMNYENVVCILNQREGHKLDEWNEFCRILKDLPYISKITCQ